MLFHFHHGGSIWLMFATTCIFVSLIQWCQANPAWLTQKVLCETLDVQHGILTPEDMLSSESVQIRLENNGEESSCYKPGIYYNGKYCKIKIIDTKCTGGSSSPLNWTMFIIVYSLYAMQLPSRALIPCQSTDCYFCNPRTRSLEHFHMSKLIEQTETGDGYSKMDWRIGFATMLFPIGKFLLCAGTEKDTFNFIYCQ